MKFLEIQKESPMLTITFNFMPEKLKFNITCNENREYKSLYEYMRKQNNDSKLNQSDKKKCYSSRGEDESNEMMSPYATK